jgi:hypothetical protein
MPEFKDFTGEKIGRLTVIRRTENDKKNNSLWICVCECGKETVVRGIRLKNKETLSCGCVRRADLTNQRFGILQVIKFHHSDDKGVTFWECSCDCGNNKVIRSGDLKRGSIKSCGCYGIQTRADSIRKHGMTGTPIYAVWRGTKQRCDDKNHEGYANYGGRGIKYCDNWKAFEGFYNDMGEAYQTGLTIDRKNNDGNYEPENCRWITQKMQCNNKRDNRNIEFDGIVDTLTNHCEKHGIPFHTAKSRLNSGWSVERTFKTPVRHSKNRSA